MSLMMQQYQNSAVIGMLSPCFHAILSAVFHDIADQDSNGSNIPNWMK